LQKQQNSSIKTAINFLRTRQRFWREYYYSGELELRYLKRYVNPNKVAIDVGANVGLYTYHLSRFAQHVYTFEPNQNYVNIVENLGLSNVTIEPVALSRSSGSVELRVPRVNGARDDFGMASIEVAAVGDDKLSHTMAVQIRTLDSYNYKRVGFIKIDVEGHEEGVLDGALNTIGRDRPIILAEIEERHNPGGIFRIANKLHQIGYSASFFVDGEQKDISLFDPEVHQVVTLGLDGGGHSRRSIKYFNNFLFQCT
jgi:FkbM family methyltransferase